MLSRFALKYLFIIFLILGCFFSEKVMAVSPSSILINVIPENPEPGENVSIALSSYAADLDSVLISWSLNGKPFLSGIGRKSISFSAPAAGSESVAIAKIAFPDGELDIRVPIRPNSLTLLWQATDSFVPPFYRGKALPVGESSVRIVAMPEIIRGGTPANPKEMVYAWKIDYSNDQTNSGYGRNHLVYDTDYLDSSNNIGVVVTTTDQKFSAEKTINIRTFDPKILFYKRDLTLGTLFEKALLGNHKIENDEVIEAVPYFISPKTIFSPVLTWNWSINNNTVSVSSARKNLIPLKAGEGLSGVAKLRLDIENRYKIFQTTAEEVNIEF